MRKSLIAALFLVPLASSCAVLAGLGAGAVVASEAADQSVYVGQLPSSATKAWAQTKVSLSNLSLKPITVDNEAMKATAEIEGATVDVNVATYDHNRCEITVRAKKFMMNSGETAKFVFDKIVADLENQR